MEPIESEIKLVFNEIDNLIQKNPIQSIKSLNDDKEIELVNKFGAELVAMYWPEFDTKENGLFVKNLY